MTKDRYSDDHTIEVVGGSNNLSIGVVSTGVTNCIVSGDIAVYGVVDGALTTNNAVNVGGALTVTGPSQFNNNVTVNSSYSITTSAISSPNSTNLEVSSNSSNISIVAPISKKITLGSINGSVAFEIKNDTPKFTFTAKKSSSAGIVKIDNTSNDSAADGLDIQLGRSTPDSGNSWIRFLDGTGTRRGRIRGTPGFSDNSDRIVAPGDDNETVSAGEVVYASGSADYAEWVMVGDLSEWSEFSVIDDTVGLPEGHVVYVRDKAFWREGPGTPMIVTHRAIVVGNEKDGNGPGEILSFIGQVPVLVSGPVNSGDFLVPAGGSFCVAKSLSGITLQDYISSIGVAWEANDNSSIKKVLCAIGVRSTYEP